MMFCGRRAARFQFRRQRDEWNRDDQRHERDFCAGVKFHWQRDVGYTIVKNFGGTNSSVITISVTNVPPVANPDSYGVGETAPTPSVRC